MDNKYCEEYKTEKLLFDSINEAQEYINLHNGIKNIKYVSHYCMSCNGWHINTYIIDEKNHKQWYDRLVNKYENV